jgi:hypothetical protein
MWELEFAHHENWGCHRLCHEECLSMRTTKGIVPLVHMKGERNVLNVHVRGNSQNPGIERGNNFPFWYKHNCSHDRLPSLQNEGLWKP